MRLIPFIVLGGWLAGCSTDVGEAAQAGQRRDEVVGANDATTPEANTVVLVSYTAQNQYQKDLRASGTLISPLLVLTANHIITGSDTAPGIGSWGDVRLGQGQRLLPVNPKRAPAVRLNRPLDRTEADRARDMAVMFLDAEKLDRDPQLGRLLLELPIERPSLTLPPGTPITNTQDPSRDDWTFSPAARLAGWSRAYRTVGSVGTAVQKHLQGDGLWMSYEMNRAERGDSGGPLFTVRPNGTRDPFGVISGVDSSTGRTDFADLTAPDAKAWLLAQVVDPPSNHTAKWRAKHPPRAPYTDRWLGEADYVGPCQTQSDPDCDHWYDAHDNCPGVFNFSQVDSDDDGFGDACPCPCDATGGYQDYDGDGVCAVACPQQRADNCPKVKNPLQENCNADAERARNATVLGDACDPVPCPFAQPVQTGSTGGCTGNPQIGQSCAGRQLFSRIDVTPLAPHFKDGDEANQGSFGAPAKAVLQNVSTQFRFCQSNPSMGFDCHAASSISDLHLMGAETLWRKVTLGTLTCVSGGCTVAPDAHGQSYVLTYDDVSKRQFGWDYAADWALWSSSMPALPAPENYPECGLASVGPGTCLDGTFWSHADSAVGDTISMVGNITVGLHGAGLTNHYVDVRPDAAFSFLLAGKGAITRRFVGKWRSAPDPIPYERFRQGVHLVFVEGGYVNVMSGSGEPYELPREGASAPQSTALKQLLQGSPVTWVAAAEPLAEMGRLDARIEAVLLAPDGISPLEYVVNAGGQLKLGSEVSLPAFTQQPDAERPLARTGVFSFLSSSAGGLFALGGMTAAGAPLHDVWFHNLTGDWRRVPTGQWELSTLMAATFSPADGRLWVLDRDGNAGSEVVRLVRIDAATGDVQLLGTCPRTAAGKQYFFSLDLDGAVLLAASDAAGSLVARVGVTTDGRAELSQVDTSHGPLSEQVWAGKDGYTFVWQDPAGGPPTVTSAASMSWTGSPGSLCAAF
ncbi:MAG: thrombospondin type 3 repeat-containing protein [Myxococcota bacterium]